MRWYEWQRELTICSASSALHSLRVSAVRRRHEERDEREVVLVVQDTVARCARGANEGAMGTAVEFEACGLGLSARVDEQELRLHALRASVIPLSK